MDHIISNKQTPLLPKCIIYCSNAIVELGQDPAVGKISLRSTAEAKLSIRCKSCSD